MQAVKVYGLAQEGAAAALPSRNGNRLDLNEEDALRTGTGSVAEERTDLVEMAGWTLGVSMSGPDRDETVIHDRNSREGGSTGRGRPVDERRRQRRTVLRKRGSERSRRSP